MSTTHVPDPDLVQAHYPHQNHVARKKRSAEAEQMHIEEKQARKSSVDDIEDAKRDLSHGKMDKELAKYAGGAAIDISPEENDRLRRMVDKRVLTVMIITYFLQAVDKGTISFASIMGLPEDAGLTDANGKITQQWSWLTSCIYITILVVEYPQVRRTDQFCARISASPSSLAPSLCRKLTSNASGRTTLYPKYLSESTSAFPSSRGVPCSLVMQLATTS